MSKYKIKDANLARLINTFAFAKGFSYHAASGYEGMTIGFMYKDIRFYINLYDDEIYRNITYIKKGGKPVSISILPTESEQLDGFGLMKGYKRLCKLIGCDIELSSDENCTLDFIWEDDWYEKEISLREEKKKVSRKMKPYYLAFKDVSFKDVRSKVKSSESLIKKYFVISSYENLFLKIDYYFAGAIRSHIANSKKQVHEFINRKLQDVHYLTPTFEWKSEMPIQGSSNVGLQSIQVEPKQSLSQFIDDICTKNPNTFKHSNPRIINKNQIKNYVSEYNNDRDFYEYLSSNSSTQP